MKSTINHKDTDDILNINEVARVWKLLEDVSDPEVPVLSVIDLGIIRDVIVNGDRGETNFEVIVIVTPTYSGCPAMDMISMNIKLQLISHGYKNVKTISILSPAWTTEWMTEDGKKKLTAYGIAAPHKLSDSNETDVIECPQCRSSNTRLLSQFGSTACKSLYQCIDCKEPFDYFKCH